MGFAVLQTYEVVLWGASKDVPLWRIMVQSFSEDEARADATAKWRANAVVVNGRMPPIERIEVLSDVHLNVARKQQTLFEDIAEACIGHAMTDVQGAAVNLLLTGVQRQNVKLVGAEARWDELMGRGREALRHRYGKTADAASESEIAKRLTS